MAIHKNMASLQKTIDELEAQRVALQNQSAALDQILLKLMKSAQKAGPAKSPTTAPPAQTAGGPPTLGMAPLHI
jgi:prefoldin subunit 5